MSKDYSESPPRHACMSRRAVTFGLVGVGLTSLVPTARADLVTAGTVTIEQVQFNQAEMIREFDFGRDMAIRGIPWQGAPPGYAAPQGHIAQ